MPNFITRLQRAIFGAHIRLHRSEILKFKLESTTGKACQIF